MSFKLDRYYYKLQGKLAVPCEDLREWGEWMSKNDRTVHKTTIEGVLVSTVFLGLNHNYGEGDPLLFETMVFRDEEYSGTVDFDVVYEEGQSSGFWGDCIRTSSWGEAEAAHKKVVAHITERFEKALEASSNAMYKLITENCGQFS